jgi:hypothetical protein
LLDLHGHEVASSVTALVMKVVYDENNKGRWTVGPGSTAAGSKVSNLTHGRAWRPVG